MANKPNWTPQQQQAIRERDREVVVCAAAGSGKTAVLVQRVLRAALGGEDHAFVPLEKMLVVTFTKAAAAEMKARLEMELLGEREKLRSAIQSGEQLDGGTSTKLKVLNRQLLALPMAQISTIDSFLTDTVRRYGYLEGIELGKVLGEEEARLVRHRIATEMLDAALDGTDNEVTGLALAWGGRDGLGAEDLSQVRSDSGLRNLVLKLSEFCKSLADPNQWFTELFEGRDLDSESFDASHPLLQKVAGQLDAWVTQSLAHDSETSARLRVQYPDAVYSEIINRRGRVLNLVNLAGGWDACAIAFQRLLEKQDDLYRKPTLLGYSSKGLDDEQTKAWLKARHEHLKKSATGWLELFATPWADIAASENASRKHILVLWRLMQRFDELYSAYKTQRSVCDFGDLSSGAFRLLATHDDAGKPGYRADNSLVPSSVALEYRKRFALLVVDEFQDTNPLQEALLDLVTSDAAVGTQSGRPVFVVGDIKQSIYGFRLAEPKLLARRKKRLAADTAGGSSIQLAKNFRSRGRVLDAINFIFLGLMDEGLGGENYSHNQLEVGADYSQLFESVDAEAEPDLPATLHLVRRAGSDNLSEDDELTKNQLQYRQVAKVLRGILSGGQRIYDKSAGEVRSVAWRDMVVLLRSGASGRLEDLRAVLESAGIPTYAPARSGFFERPEISDALALLRLLNNPRDDISLACALTGPAGGMTAVELLELSQTELKDDCPAGLWDKAIALVESNAGSRIVLLVQNFLDRYHRWRDAARFKPIPELLWQVLQESGLLVAYSPATNGGQRVENLLRLHSLAFEVSAAGQQGLPWFLQYLEQSRRAKGDLGEAPVLGEGEDVVRVMTVHQSKGLEFPVVVVPNMEKQFNEMDLKVDLLWHRDLGLGGRHVEFYANPPKRTDSLSRRIIKDANWRDIQAEELRVLYVALTRARERLELIGFADEKLPEQLSMAKPNAAAKSWLDWIAPKFASEIEAAWEAPLSTTSESNNPWQVNVVAGVASLPKESPLAAAVPPEQACLDKIKTRILSKYSFTSLTKIGTKLSVTALAKHAGDEGQAVSHNVLTDAGEAAVVAGQPKFVAEVEKVTAAAIGSATHTILAELDYRQPPDMSGLESERKKLISAGRLDGETAAKLNLAAIERAAREIFQRFVGEDSQIHAELAVGMQLGVNDPAVLAYYNAGDSGGESTEFTFVQGAIDLLVVNGEQALVIDFKTDRNANAELLKQRHQTQLELYCRFVELMLPKAQVSYVIYGLDSAGAVGPFPSGDA